MNGMGLDLCMRLGAAAVDRIASMILSRVAIQPEQVLGGTLSFRTPQLVRAICPNSLEFILPFAFASFFDVSGSIRLLAQVTAFTQNGGTRACLGNFRVVSISLPTAPNLQGIAMNAVAQLLPSQLCVDLP